MTPDPTVTAVSDERLRELLAGAVDEYNAAANTNDHEAGAFWGPMKDALRELLRARSALSPAPAPVTAVSELKPCPFCPDGGLPRFLSAAEARRPTSCAHCDRCCTDGPPGLTREQAIERWNRRSALADVGECEALVEELRNDFINIVVGGCTCGTKPPDPALHELNCHYRMAEAGLARIEAYRTGKQPRPAAEAVCTHCMFTPSERARPDHYRVRPCRYCSPAAHTAQVTRALEYGNTVAGFIGWLSADIPELRCVEVPRLAESYDRFLRRLAEQGSGGDST